MKDHTYNLIVITEKGDPEDGIYKFEYRLEGYFDFHISDDPKKFKQEFEDKLRETFSLICSGELSFEYFYTQMKGKM